MKKINRILFFLFFCICFHSVAQEDSLVIQAFEDYKTAILNDKGEEAVNYLDSRTINYYTYILRQVKTADSMKLDSLLVMDRMIVLMMRQYATRDEIYALDGKTLIVYAIKNGMVGKSSVLNNTIGEVVINGNFARGSFVHNGTKTPFYFHFYKEEGAWKIDLTSLFALGETAFLQVIKNSGKSQNEFVLSNIELTTGHKTSADIWKPLE